MSAGSLADAEALIEKEFPIGLIVNQTPESDSASWIGDSGEISRMHDVPVIRCSIPSPSWLRQNGDLADCLTKPVSRERLTQTVSRFCHGPSKILVVDDDPGFVSLITRMLLSMDEHHRILPAFGGSQAVALARLEKPDLILLDLLMPEMDGFEVIRALRDGPAVACKMVAVTATSYAEEALLQRGCYFTVTQPRGLSTVAVVDLLNEVFRVSKPHYADSMTRAKD
jgi:CheY-like chemotaxis protein